MNKFCHFYLLTLLAILSFSCGTNQSGQTLKEWMTPNGKVKVLSTTAMIDDLVKRIGNEHIEAIVLIKGELDPHSYQMVKGDDEKLAFADIIFYNGLGLEHNPGLQSYLLKQNKAVPLGNKIMDSQNSLILYDRGQLDPHIWMDISLWAKTIPFIVEALSAKDPQHAAVFRANGEALLQQMTDAHQHIYDSLQTIPAKKRYLVTSHDAFNYFTRAYLAEKGEPEIQWHKRVAAPEGLAPESQISATDIQAIIDHLYQHRIHVIFPESNVNRDSIKKIVSAAKEKGMDVKIADIYLYADAMGERNSDGDSYLKMIHHNAMAIKQFLNDQPAEIPHP